MAHGLPSDRKLLAAIYRANYAAFIAFSEANKNRSTKIWVPIDIDKLARKFRTDPDMIFGRLYYHLNGKYAQQIKEGERLDFFQLRVGADRHCVNFPYLASVLADLDAERRRFVIATAIAALSLVVSIASIAIALYVRMSQA